MSDYELHREQFVPKPVDEVFAFFADAGNLEAITPPWLNFRIVTPRPINMRVGTFIEYEIRWRFVRLRWLTEITEWRPGVCFVDEQIRGPYKRWHHTHRFEPADGGTRVIDLVRYRLPLGPIGDLMHLVQVRRDLDGIFDFRRERIDALMGTRHDPARIETNQSV